MLAGVPSDPLIGADRTTPLAATSKIDALAVGSFYVNMIAVAMPARSRGIGRLLLNEAIARAMAAGFDRISLSTFSAETELLQFYRSVGFEIVGACAIASDPRIRLE